MNRPRVLHVISQDQRRGAESAAVMLAERLRQRGLESRVVALAPGSHPSGMPLTVLGPSHFAASTMTRLRREIRSSDVVVAHGSRTLPAVAAAGFAAGRPAVYQNIGDPSYWAGSGLRRLRVRALLTRMAAVAALTPDSLAVLRDQFGVDHARLVVCRNMRDSAHYVPSDRVGRDHARRTLGVEGDAPVVAVVGALAPEKRVGLAVEAVARIDSARLLVVGEGVEREAVERLCRERLPGRAVLTGSLSDVRPVYAAADVLLMTSASEGVPGTLVEAGLSGVPSVTSNVGYVDDVVEDGVTGALVRDDDPESFTRSLSAVLEQAVAMGERARNRCRERFDVDRVTDVWETLILRLARS